MWFNPCCCGCDSFASTRKHENEKHSKLQAPSSKLQAPSSRSLSLIQMAVFTAVFSILNLLFRSRYLVLIQWPVLSSRITSWNVTSNFLNSLNPIRSDAWLSVVSECSEFLSSLRFCRSPLDVFRPWQTHSSIGVSGPSSPLFLFVFLGV